ncbi:alpha/beta fold hydrolase [Lentzea sp. NPDC058436]|uniref:alpha/beta fold hydrolase n=1 Tax=Lentzea sp. NPDC058436 TaxID=3346499 RepID=UPI0036488142
MVAKLTSINTNGITMNVAIEGEGPPVVLLHGFPHTWQLWREVMGPLAAHRRVIAPDLRGFGGSTRAEDGFDADTMASDLEGLLDALREESADVVAIDAGVPSAFLFALRRPERVRRLVLMESTLGTLAGAEDFFAAGPPWWFGFHAVPGLAERVVADAEAEYLDFFLQAGTPNSGLPPELRAAFVEAYTGTDALRCAFSYYRELPRSGRQIAEAVATRRLTVPTLAVGAHPVGPALHRQLEPVADSLSASEIPDCGHIIPLDRPRELLSILLPFLDASSP